jgi:hypothetical protein
MKKVAVYEDDKRRIAEIFESINRAREQPVVRICITAIIIPGSFLLFVV